MEAAWNSLLERKKDRERLQALLNILQESAYFYQTDNPDIFSFLRRHKKVIGDFYQTYYDWELLVDEKCARVYKKKWYNSAVTPANRDIFRFANRDSCLAFMIFLEFFEHQLEESGLAVADPDNLRFCFGDLLIFTSQRLQEVFKEKATTYHSEYVRSKILRPMFPILERYRFIQKITPPAELSIKSDETIYEALPAMYHYNTSMLAQSISEDISEDISETISEDISETISENKSEDSPRE